MPQMTAARSPSHTCLTTHRTSILSHYKRIERLFCKNERATIRTRLLHTGHVITLVPVATILVAGIRLNFLDPPTDLRNDGPRTISPDVPLAKGEEMGWFQHESTIIVFAPAGSMLTNNIYDGARNPRRTTTHARSKRHVSQRIGPPINRKMLTQCWCHTMTVRLLGNDFHNQAMSGEPNSALEKSDVRT
jgi:hypothetical protein